MDRTGGQQPILEQQNGTWTRLGVIAGDGTGPVTSQTTAVSFVIPPGARLVLQPDVDVVATPTPLEQAGPPVDVDADLDLVLRAGIAVSTCLRTWQSDLSINSVSGPFAVRVLRLG